MNALRPDGSRSLLLLVIRPGDNEEVVRDVGERDPRLLPVQHVPIALFHGGRLDGADVAARARLGQRVAGDHLSLRLRDQVLLFLLPRFPTSAA